MPHLNEAEIIEQAKSGNQLAFRALVESFQGFVYSIAYRFTGNASEAEDLMQETFIRCWKNLDRYNAEYKMKTWLGKIVSNLCLDYLKSARRKNESKAVDFSIHIMDDANPEKEFETKELHSIILKLADRLTPKQRAVFILRDLEMLEVDEVCEILGMNSANVKSNLYYARLNMKADLLKHYTIQKK